MNLRRTTGGPLVIGHRGAAAVAPENTLAALDAGIAAGADLVEFDIGPDLGLGHSLDEAPAEQVSLDDALAFLGPQRIGLHLDVKQPGYEAAVWAAVCRHGLEDRALISTAWAASTRAFARLAPDLPRAIGYPRDRYGVSRVHWSPLAVRAGAATLRQAMPVRVPLLLRYGRADVLSLHHALCSPAAVATAHLFGAPVLAWTVNDPATVVRLAELGVDAIVSDDPAMARAALRA